MKIINALLIALSFVLSNQVLALGEVDYLNVDGDIVYFSTTAAKSAPIPECASSGNSDKFAVSLTTEMGQAIYSLLITAMAVDLPIAVESAGDCVVSEDIEQAKGVALIMEQMPATVSYLNIHDGAMHFALKKEKSEEIPQCANTDTNEYFAVSLKTEAGRSMLSLLITALASNLPLEAKTASDCADVPGIERALALTLALDGTESGNKDYFTFDYGFKLNSGAVLCQKNNQTCITMSHQQLDEKYTYTPGTFTRLDAFHTGLRTSQQVPLVQKTARLPGSQASIVMEASSDYSDYSCRFKITGWGKETPYVKLNRYGANWVNCSFKILASENNGVMFVRVEFDASTDIYSESAGYIVVDDKNKFFEVVDSRKQHRNLSLGVGKTMTDVALR